MKRDYLEISVDGRLGVRAGDRDLFIYISDPVLHGSKDPEWKGR